MLMRGCVHTFTTIFFLLLVYDTLKRTWPACQIPRSQQGSSLSLSLSRRQIMEAKGFKVGCLGSPRRILATMSLSLPLCTLRPSSPHPVSPLSPPLMSTRGSQKAVTRGPTLSCERKLTNECHSLQGARLEWQQNNGGRYERHGHTAHKLTHIHTSSNTFL